MLNIATDNRTFLFDCRFLIYFSNHKSRSNDQKKLQDGCRKVAFLNPGQREINKHHVGMVLFHLLLAGVFRAQGVQLLLGPPLVVGHGQLQVKPAVPLQGRLRGRWRLQVDCERYEEKITLKRNKSERNGIVFTVDFYQPACYHSDVPSCNHLAISFGHLAVIYD